MLLSLCVCVVSGYQSQGLMLTQQATHWLSYFSSP